MCLSLAPLTQDSQGHSGTTAPSASHLQIGFTTHIEIDFLISFRKTASRQNSVVGVIIEHTPHYFESRTWVVVTGAWARPSTIESFHVFVVTIGCQRRRFAALDSAVPSFFRLNTMESASLASTFSTRFKSCVPSCAR